MEADADHSSRKHASSGHPIPSADPERQALKPHCQEASDAEFEPGGSGREKLERHRREVGGSVSVPERWGQEELLKDWIDSCSFFAFLPAHGIVSAREALVAESRETQYYFKRFQDTDLIK